MKNSSSDHNSCFRSNAKNCWFSLCFELFKKNKELKGLQNFSVNGDFHFWNNWRCKYFRKHSESKINACGVLQLPVVMSIWDDGYGISVPSEYHTTRNDLSKALSGFQRSSKSDKGYELFTYLCVGLY